MIDLSPLMRDEVDRITIGDKWIWFDWHNFTFVIMYQPKNERSKVFITEKDETKIEGLIQ